MYCFNRTTYNSDKDILLCFWSLPVLFSFLPLVKLAYSQTQKCSLAIYLVDEMDIIFCLEEIFPILFYFLFEIAPFYMRIMFEQVALSSVMLQYYL